MTIAAGSRYGMPQLSLVDSIDLSPFQVRKAYGKIDELASNIEKHGLLQPILIRPIGERYEIVHGHRRFYAVKSLGWKYIQAFVKELSDTEAIIIQGSENLKRKDYDAIEEATLYRNYRKYVHKEQDRNIGAEEIAETFDSSRQNVQDKLGLLDLPDSVQSKIIDGVIPVGKALALVTLTREVGDDASSPRNVPGIAQKLRTDRYYDEIEVLAGEIEKGPQGGLRTKSAVRRAIDLIQEGKPLGEAVNNAKLRESIDRAKRQAEAGKDPKEIIRGIIDAQQDPKSVVDATVKLNIMNLIKLLNSGMLMCPFCGEDDLEWGCEHRKVNECE